MNKIIIFVVIFSLCQNVLASNEILNLLNSDSDLTVDEKNALQPLFGELQKQYDYIISEANQNRDSMDTKYMLLYDSTQKEFEHQYETVLKRLQTPALEFNDLEFFNVHTLIDFSISANLTESEKIEAQEIKATMLALLDKVQMSVDELEALSKAMEAKLIEINKPAIVAKIYNALKEVFYAAVRVSRAAYCTYSYIPQLNESLQYIHNGVDCYKHTIGLVQGIKTEITNALKSIRNYVEDLAKIFNDIQSKTSIVSKILAIVSNVQNIKGDVEKIAATVQQLNDKWQNNVPNAVNGTKECASDFLSTLPQVVETVSTVTTCILFVDDTTVDYDFMKPEEEDDRDYD